MRDEHTTPHAIHRALIVSLYVSCYRACGVGLVSRWRPRSALSGAAHIVVVRTMLPKVEPWLNLEKLSFRLSNPFLMEMDTLCVYL